MFKEEKDALSAIKQFNGETADGKTLSVKSVGNQPVNLAARLDGMLPGDGSVDALLPSTGSSCVTLDLQARNFFLIQKHRKMRSDDVLIQDPRATVMITPPGGDPKDYEPQPWTRGGRGRGRGRGRPSRGGKRGTGNGAAQMEVDR